MKEKEFVEDIKNKLGIEHLNEMQEKMLLHSGKVQDIILLSPTGSGKTLAFTLGILKMLKPSTGRVQCVVIAPSRELVVQIAGVMRSSAEKYRVVALYGGHNVEDEINSLKVVPDIIVSTPGRLLDHSKRHNIELLPVRILVVDEFDKIMELGFEKEMAALMDWMKNISKTILTSATPSPILPEYLDLQSPLTLNFLSENEELKGRLKINKIISDNNDKLDALLMLLHNIHSGDKIDKCMVFVNHRESAERTYEYLKKRKVPVVLYHGALDQRERETAVSLFNNGSCPVMVATDLAARGLDIEKVKSVIHYHQPLTSEVFTHRNGRTARVDEEGDVYLLMGPEEELKEFIDFDVEMALEDSKKADMVSEFMTLYVSAGKREKISRGDIVGFLIKEGGIDSEDIGKIDVFDHYSLVAVRTEKVPNLLDKIEGKKLKGEKRRISPLK